MFATVETFQAGMSLDPAAPQSAPREEQHEAPVPSLAARQFATASLSAAPSANAATARTGWGDRDASAASAASAGAKRARIATPRRSRADDASRPGARRCARNHDVNTTTTKMKQSAERRRPSVH
jgi:hypothetical protein